MKFGKLAELNNTGLVVTPKHEAWVRSVQEIVLSDEAITFTAEQLRAQANPRKREGSFSASSLGSCLRSQQFTFHGVEKPKIDSKSAGIFQNGTYMHLRWQAEGLTAHWLTAAEVPVPPNPYQLSGTMDGTIEDDGVLELKSANDRSFSSMLAFGPTNKYKLQGAAYLLASNRRYVSFLIENKNTQEYMERVLTRNDLPLKEAEERAQTLWHAEDSQHLLPVLDSVYEGKGECAWCPFKEKCLDYKSYEDFDDQEG